MHYCKKCTCFLNKTNVCCCSCEKREKCPGTCKSNPQMCKFVVVNRLEKEKNDE